MTKKKKDRKEEILNAALTCFNENGYSKTSIDDISAKIGVTKGAIYWHFESKKELFIQVFNHKVKKYFYKVLSNIEQSCDSEKKIMNILEQPASSLNDNLHLYRFALEFINVGTRDPDIKKELTLFYKERIEVYKEIFLGEIKSGKLKNIDPKAIALHWNFLLIGLFLVHFTSDLFFDPISQNRINIKIFLEGISR